MGDRSPKAADELTHLVEMAAKGDQAAMAELIEKTQNRLFRFCLTLTGNRTAAEDLCQEVYLRVFTKLSSLDKPGAFIDWIFRIAKNLFLDHIRSGRSKESELDENDASLMGIEQGDMALILAVHKVLSQFEPEDRWLLLLVDLEEHSYKEAGEILGISEDAVRSRLFRIRKIFLQSWEGPETK